MMLTAAVSNSPALAAKCSGVAPLMLVAAWTQLVPTVAGSATTVRSKKENEHSLVLIQVNLEQVEEA